MINPHDMLPARAGLGLKAEHYHHVIDSGPDIGFFEVHAENYMGEGGPPHRYLSAIRADYPLSLHGVGLSIGADRPLDPVHLRRLRDLIARYQPAIFSEHLAWSSHDAGFLNDLLPLPYTPQTLRLVADHVDQVQNVLRREILIENPSAYVSFHDSTLSETDFLGELVRRTGCFLLLDINNVAVSSCNQRYDPMAYLDAFPLDSVQEIHLAGHAREDDGNGGRLLIDTHDRMVEEFVWALFRHVVARVGPIPTLIEWDASVPPWATLQAEATRADAIMQEATRHAVSRPPLRGPAANSIYENA